MTPPILELSGLTKSYTAGGAAVAHVVGGVSLKVGRGETYGLVGESGSGKSTIGRLSLRLVEADAGTIRFGGIDLRALSGRELKRLRRRMQIIFQDPFSSLDPRVRIGTALAEPIRLHRLRRGAEVDQRVEELLATVGLSPAHRHRYPHEFSGGPRQRIAIARALAVEPELIVCDEAVSALDVSIQAQILNLLEDLQRDLGVSYLFISHDLGVVRHMAARIGVLYAGRLVEEGPAETIFADPRHPYTRMLLAAAPRLFAGPGAAPRTEIAGAPPSPFDLPPGCAFASRCPFAEARCRTEAPGPDSYRDAGRRAACWRSAELPPQAAEESTARMSPAFRRRLDLLHTARREALA
ncbi:ABC transporter ATP-binding protein [Acidimangrovimonas sediminis]|uniref:ABC transporter ATP-binding protein n=1 Tax=Acidimangrovimonas sediminis TaxID=2056283 RepID=UPI000C80603F|nr:ABC transporter ATP-binding protein [Acidimangrovimonas sediminis]